MSAWGLVRRKWPGPEGLKADEKERVKEAYTRWSEHKLRPDPADVDTLFKYYNRYVYHSPNDRHCGGCVQFIYNYWKDRVGEW